jgi:hypothetical protein
MYINGNMRLIKTIPGMGEGRIKNIDRRNEFNYGIV